MNPGKTHLISELQPNRLKSVASQLHAQTMTVYRGGVASPDGAQLSAKVQEELTMLMDAYNEIIYRHAAELVWDEEYFEESVSP